MAPLRSAGARARSGYRRTATVRASRLYPPSYPKAARGPSLRRQAAFQAARGWHNFFVIAPRSLRPPFKERRPSGTRD